jgi:hypothetical protein
MAIRISIGVLGAPELPGREVAESTDTAFKTGNRIFMTLEKRLSPPSVSSVIESCKSSRSSNTLRRFHDLTERRE